MSDSVTSRRGAAIRAVVVAGAVVGILDGIDAVVALRLALGLDPVTIYQFVASGALGPSAFRGGLATALLGVFVHFVIAFAAAAVFTAAATRIDALTQHYAVSGLAYGVGVYFFMNYVVIPLSKIPASAPSLALFLNGVIGHALLVGVPTAYFARRYLAAESRSAEPGGRAARAGT